MHTKWLTQRHPNVIPSGVSFSRKLLHLAYHCMYCERPLVWVVFWVRIRIIPLLSSAMVVVIHCCFHFSILVYVFWRRKRDMPTLSTTMIWTPIFEWYMVMCETKNEHQRDMVLQKESGPNVRNMLSIRSSINNMIKRTYMTT